MNTPRIVYSSCRTRGGGSTKENLNIVTPITSTPPARVGFWSFPSCLHASPVLYSIRIGTYEYIGMTKNMKNKNHHPHTPVSAVCGGT